MAIRSVRSLRTLKHKRVLVRVDFNVPIHSKQVADDSRLRASIPTIEFLQNKGAKIILVTHLGRPEGKRITTLSTAPIAKRLGELLGSKVHHVSGIVGTAVQKAIEAMKPGEILLLENVRFSPHEQKQTDLLAAQLAALADIFVLDGFAVAHRADASVAGVAKYLPSYAGLLLSAEIDGLSKVLGRPARPFVATIGGIKMETKVPVIRALLPKVDMLLLGGGILNTYLKARGYGVGESLVDQQSFADALSYTKKKNVLFPIDVVVGSVGGSRGRQVMIEKKPHQICKRDEAIYDIGPATVRLFAEHIKKGKTLLWNGAMGYFQQKPFDVGTLAIARLIATRSKGPAYGVIGGGETVQAMELSGMTDDIDLVSTGGGAMLEFLAGEKLPGIEALKRK